MLRAFALFAVLFVLDKVDTQGQDCTCWTEPDATYGTLVGSTVEIPLPFVFHYYGQSYSSVHLNSEGNISFTGPWLAYTASPFPLNNFPLIAPFWADVDITAPGGPEGAIRYAVSAHELRVNWVNVGYWLDHEDLVNSFQLVLTDGTSDGAPNGNIGFCYKSMEWTTGDASNGVNGFGGYDAVVGTNSGEGPYWQLGLFSAPDSTLLGPQEAGSGVDWLNEKHFVLNVADPSVPPVFVSDFECDTLEMIVGDPVIYHMIVIAAGPDQDVSCTSVCPTLNTYEQLSEGSAATVPVDFSITPGQEDIGVHTITFTATSEERDNLISTYEVHVRVGLNTGIEIGTDAEWSLGPNPVTDRLTLTVAQGQRPSLIEVISLDGRVHRQEVPSATTGTLIVDVTSLPQGAYVLRTTTGNTLRSDGFVKVDR